jgi:hypothetical protein
MAGAKDGWARLAKNLRAEIDEELIEVYRGTVSLPFEVGGNRQIAVKIVDARGIESLKIVERYDWYAQHEDTRVRWCGSVHYLGNRQHRFTATHCGYRRYPSNAGVNMKSTIDQLIINSPYEEPKHHRSYNRETRSFALKTYLCCGSWTYSEEPSASTGSRISRKLL